MKFKNRETGEIFEYSIAEVLLEINRDRSEEWLDFNGSDWKEGLDYTYLDLLEE